MTAIVLFDGVCNFCDASVQFIIKRDTKGYFHFAALQSGKGEELLEKYHIPNEMNSVLVIENEKVYDSSDAALVICKHLNGLWKLLFVFKIIPKPMRDYMYKYIARNRYKWFGQKDSCTLPSPEIRHRFL